MAEAFLEYVDFGSDDVLLVWLVMTWVPFFLQILPQTLVSEARHKFSQYDKVSAESCCCAYGPFCFSQWRYCFMIYAAALSGRFRSLCEEIQQ